MEGTQALAGTGSPAQMAPWPQRAWALGAIGAAGGVAIDLLLAGGTTEEPVRQGLATFLIVGLLAFGHGWTRGHLLRALVIAMLTGAMLALVFVWNGMPTGEWSGGQGWRIAAAVVAAAIFIPLAQTGGEHGARLPGRWSLPSLRGWMHRYFPYSAVHGHAWTNLLIGGLSLLFAGAFFLMLLLMAELFNLIGITLLRELVKQDMVIAGVLGGAMGASTGLLRDRQRVIASLQAVAMTVLRVAAPVLAISLALFLASLPLTGLAPLWDATRATTPILLSAVIVALLLANSVIGDGGEEESRAPVLRWAALILLLVSTPLAVIAAVSTGLRIAQYGWTPERLWAATFVGMACVVALGCLIAVVRYRSRRADGSWTGGNWTDGVREANLWLAFIICAVALLLSTPLVRFDGIAARDQVARLADGRTTADAFDYNALWFSFGPEGRAAIRRLAVSGATAEIRQRSRDVQALESKWATDPAAGARRAGKALDARLTVLPVAVPLPQPLRAALVGADACGEQEKCLVQYRAGQDFAVVVRDGPRDCATCVPATLLLVRKQGSWAVNVGPDNDWATDQASARARAAALRQGKLEVRIEPYRQIYIDGKPFAAPFPIADRVENSAALHRAP